MYACNSVCIMRGRNVNVLAALAAQSVMRPVLKRIRRNVAASVRSGSAPRAMRRGRKTTYRAPRRRFQRKLRKVRRFKRGSRRLGYAKTFPVRNIFKRGRKAARSYNRGSLDLSRIMQSGGDLPKVTRVNLILRSRGVMPHWEPNPAPSYNTNYRMNVFTPNILSLVQNWNAGAFRSYISNFKTSAMHYDFWKGLYTDYCVRGAKGYFKITPTLSPINSVGFGVPGVNDIYSNMFNGEPGYYFTKLRYVKFTSPSSAGSGTQETIGSVDLNWDSEASFLIDPTVRWVRERRPKVQSYSFSPVIGNSFMPDGGVGELPYDVTTRRISVPANTTYPNVSTWEEGTDNFRQGVAPTYTLEMDTKSYYIPFRYSSKKHQQLVDRADYYYTLLDYVPSTPGVYDFNVVVGYVRFDPLDQRRCHINLLGHDSMIVEYVNRMSVSLRGPKDLTNGIDPDFQSRSRLSVFGVLPEVAGVSAEEVDDIEDDEDIANLTTDDELF